MQQLPPDDFSSELARQYEYYQEQIKRNLVKRGHEKEDANDYYQEIFLNILENSARKGMMLPQTDDHRRKWLYRIVRNLEVDEYRRTKSIGFIYLPESEAYTQTAGLMVEGHEDWICDRDRLQEVLAQMPLRHQQCVRLKDQGYKQKDIAAILDISESAVSEILRDVKTQLQRKYFQVPFGQQREIKNRQNWGQDALKLLSSMKDDLDVFTLGWIPASPELDEFLPSGGSKFIDEAVQRVVDNTDLLSNSWVKQGNKHEYIVAKLIEVDPSEELLAWIRTLITYNSHH